MASRTFSVETLVSEMTSRLLVVLSILISSAACATSSLNPSDERYLARLEAIRASTDVPDPSLESSFVEWMRGVEKEIGDKRTRRVLGFLFTAGLHTALEAQDEASWPDSCDSRGASFCPRSDWNKEMIFLLGITRLQEMVPIMAIWCEHPARGGKVVSARQSGGRGAAFCDVNGVPIAGIIHDNTPSFEKWWAIEPVASAAIDSSAVKAAFALQGFTSRANLALQREQREARRARDEARRAQDLQAQARLAMERMEYKRDNELPRIRQIGSRICRVDSGVRYIGFTEGVSPDNGRIQIRVSDAHADGYPGLRPGGFQSSIIWDDPMNWDIC